MTGQVSYGTGGGSDAKTLKPDGLAARRVWYFGFETIPLQKLQSLSGGQLSQFWVYPPLRYAPGATSIQRLNALETRLPRHSRRAARSERCRVDSPQAGGSPSAFASA